MSLRTILLDSYLNIVFRRLLGAGAPVKKFGRSYVIRRMRPRIAVKCALSHRSHPCSCIRSEKKNTTGSWRPPHRHCIVQQASTRSRLTSLATLAADARRRHLQQKKVAEKKSSYLPRPPLNHLKIVIPTKQGYGCSKNRWSIKRSHSDGSNFWDYF